MQLGRLRLVGLCCLILGMGLLRNSPAANEKPLSRPARLALDDLKKVFRSIESKLVLIDTLKTNRNTEPAAVERKFQEADEALIEMEKSLAAARQAAGGDDHPDVAEAITRAGELKQNVAAARTTYRQERANAAAGLQSAIGDVQNFNQTYDRCDKAYFKPLQETAVMDLHPATLASLQTVVDRFTRLEEERPALQRLLDGFTAKYGVADEQIAASLDKAGYAGRRPQVAELRQGLAAAGTTRMSFAERLVAHVDQQLAPDKVNFLSDFVKFELLNGDFKSWLQMAHTLAPDSTVVKSALAGIDARISRARRDFDLRIDKANWPSRSTRAPANAAQLAKTALQWFANSTEWGRRNQDPRAQDKEPRRPLAVVVTGPWTVQERNLLGMPTMYGLPIMLAVQLDSEKAKNLARAYQLTICTAERAGIGPRPPFDSVRVGDSYYVRPAKCRG